MKFQIKKKQRVLSFYLLPRTNGSKYESYEHQIQIIRVLNRLGKNKC